MYSSLELYIGMFFAMPSQNPRFYLSFDCLDDFGVYCMCVLL